MGAIADQPFFGIGPNLQSCRGSSRATPRPILVLLWAIVHLHPVFLVCQTFLFNLFFVTFLFFLPSPWSSQSCLFSVIERCFCSHSFSPSFTVVFLPLITPCSASPATQFSFQHFQHWISQCSLSCIIPTLHQMVYLHVVSTYYLLFLHPLIPFGHPKLKYQETVSFSLTLCPNSKVVLKQEKWRRSKLLFWGLFFIYSISLRWGGSVWMASSWLTKRPTSAMAGKHWNSVNVCGRNPPGGNDGWILVVCVWTQLD